jgi:hypothetical protein
VHRSNTCVSASCYPGQPLHRCHSTMFPSRGPLRALFSRAGMQPAPLPPQSSGMPGPMPASMNGNSSLRSTASASALTLGTPVGSFHTAGEGNLVAHAVNTPHGLHSVTLPAGAVGSAPIIRRQSYLHKTRMPKILQLFQLAVELLAVVCQFVLTSALRWPGNIVVGEDPGPEKATKGKGKYAGKRGSTSHGRRHVVEEYSSKHQCINALNVLCLAVQCMN